MLGGKVAVHLCRKNSRRRPFKNIKHMYHAAYQTSYSRRNGLVKIEHIVRAIISLDLFKSGNMIAKVKRLPPFGCEGRVDIIGICRLGVRFQSSKHIVHK